MIDKVKDTLQRHSMLRKGVRVLLCVSGGPDSVAMLSVFNSLKRDMGLKLFIAHLNHKLRGKDSDKDEEYVRGLSKRYKLPAVTAREDIKGFAKSCKLSLEEAARRMRYNFFLKVARQLNIDIIATAHTRDDQAETVLIRLLRGTGLRGLRGISPVRKLSGFNPPTRAGVGFASPLRRGADLILIRPLIDVTRKEVEEYLKEKRLKPRLDITNLESKFFRNKIRLKLLPLLEKGYSPGIKELLSNLADLLDKDYKYLNMQQEEVFKKLAKIRKNDIITFHLADFKREDPSTQRALARKAVESLKGTLDRIEYRHWRELEALVWERPPGSIVHLPGKTEVIKTRTTLRFCRPHKPRPERDNMKPAVVRIPGETYFGRKIIRAEIVNPVRNIYSEGGSEISNGVKRPRPINEHPRSEEYFDIKRCGLPLILRLREPGDRMMPLGMKGYKKIKDIFIDEKVPQKRRGNIPLVVSANGEILWLCGIKMSDRCKISSHTKKILRLRLLPA